MPTAKRMTRAEYAAHRGVSKPAVTQAIKAGRITVGPDDKIDVAQADRDWAKNSRVRAQAHVPIASAERAASRRKSAPAGSPKPKKARQQPQPGAGDAIRVKAGVTVQPPPPGPPRADEPDDEIPDYLEWRARRERTDALQAEMDLQKARGLLIEVAAVTAVWGQALSGARDHLLQLRARLAPLLAAETDAFKVELMLEAEHHQALQLLASATISVPGAEA